MNVKPLGSNQTMVSMGGVSVLYSYAVPVAAIMNNSHKAFKTDHKWSSTTSKHINKFVKGFEVVEVPQETMDDWKKAFIVR